MSRGFNHSKQNLKDRLRRERFEQQEPKALYHTPTQAAEQARAERLEAYLQSSPSGERDVEHLLDTPWRQQRDEWLREVIDADEDGT